MTMIFLFTVQYLIFQTIVCTAFRNRDFAGKTPEARYSTNTKPTDCTMFTDPGDAVESCSSLHNDYVATR